MHRSEKQRKPDRHGLTLIELLVTISVMATVTGMFVVAYRSAATEANNIRTQSTIRKINEVLTSRMQEYENCAVDFEPSIPADANFTPSRDAPAILRERLRLLGLREMMCLEMPDHPDDIKWTTEWVQILTARPINPGWWNNGFPSTKYRPTGLFRDAQFTRPVSQVRIRNSSRATRLLQKLSVPGTIPLQPLPNWEFRNANAELLYLIVEDSMINGSSAIELFGRSEIADTDGDGLNEFIDSYRRPIRWIRWPTGYRSVVRSHPDLLDPNLMGVFDDQFDRMKSDPGYSRALTSTVLRPDVGASPLVVSAGPDGLFGIRFELPPHLPEHQLPPPDDRRDPSIPKPEPDLGSSNPESVLIPQYPGYSLMSYGSRVSRSTGDVLFPTDYGGILIADPWFPRPNASNAQGTFDETDSDLRNDYPSSYRLGGLMKSIPQRVIGNVFVYVGNDDITNYEVAGAYQ